MTTRKKTPTLAQVRRLAKEKFDQDAHATVRKSSFYAGYWLASAGVEEDVPVVDVFAKSRSAALRALYAALEAL